MGIATALEHVLNRIQGVAAKAGRNAEEIKLVAVSKGVALERILEAIDAGVKILGENRVQEAQKKIQMFSAQMTSPLPSRTERGTEWHLIGHLQRNKAKTAVQLFNVIHSVDSTELAEEINRHAENLNKKQKILVQLKLSDEIAKHGVPEKNHLELFQKLMHMKNIEMEGLMTIPPFFDDPEKTRPYFKKLRQIADNLIEKGYPIRELSMGMSHDFEVAIEEGATMVRIGTAIFGERNYA